MKFPTCKQLLKNPEMRAALDRKLSTSVSRPVVRERFVVQEVSAPWYTRPMGLLAPVVVAMFAIGGYMSYSRDQVRKAIAAQELVQKKLDAEEASRAAAAEVRAEAEKSRLAALHERQERQLRADSNAAANRAANAENQFQANMNRQLEAARREAQRKEQLSKNEERPRVNETRRQLASDQASIRELCWTQYRRANC